MHLLLKKIIQDRINYNPFQKHQLSFDRMVDLYSQQKKDIFFMQIGACDGIQSDPIYKFIVRDEWKGILVEPVRYLFNELKLNYNNSKNLIFENVAIADKEGVKDFYYLENISGWLSSWKKGLGSFNPDHIPQEFKKYFYLKGNEKLVIEKIKCITLEVLIKKHNVNEVNVLLIDTEGYDHEVIRFIDFNKIKPDIILYECKHLNPNDNQECVTYLEMNGYSLYKENKNMIALRDTANDFLASSVEFPANLFPKM